MCSQLNNHLQEIYFYLTNRCNLRCCHCWVTPIYSPSVDGEAFTLGADSFDHVLEQGKGLGLEGVKFTGGEPLLHPLITDFIASCYEKNLKITIETNGTLLTSQIIESLGIIPDVMVSVSLDGATPTIHDRIRGIDGAFSLAIQGIKNLVSANIKPQVIMTVMRYNANQIDNLVKLAIELGAASVGLNIVQPVARGSKLHEKGIALSIEELVSIGEYVENDLSNHVEIPMYYGHPPAFRPLSKLFEFEVDGCGSCGIKNIISVLPDGSYAICGIGMSTPGFVLGHIHDDDLDSIWENSPLLNEIRSGLPDKLEGVCKYCIMKNACLGKCVAQSVVSNRSLWKSFWYCQDAYDRDLFPNSRLIDFVA